MKRYSASIIIIQIQIRPTMRYISHWSECVLCLVTQSSLTLCDPRREYWSVFPYPPLGIFATQGLNPCLSNCRKILHYLSHQERPRILEWVAYPFSKGSFQSRNQTGVSCIAGRFCASWATREAPWSDWSSLKSPQMINAGEGVEKRKPSCCWEYKLILLFLLLCC